MNQIIIRSDKKRGVHYYFIICGGLFFIFLSLINLFPLKVKTDNDYLEHISGIFLGLLGVMCFYYAFSIDIIEVYGDRLQILSFYGRAKKIIHRSEITKWSENVKYTKYGNFKTLTIFTNNAKYKISESSYTNYSQITNEVTKGKIRATENEGYFGSGQSNFDTVVIIVGLLFLLSIFLYQQFSK